MKIVSILGGLGSQMFKYAFYLALKQNGQDALIDTTFFYQNKCWNGYELGKLFSITSSDDVFERMSDRQKEAIMNCDANYVDVCLDYLTSFGETYYYIMGKPLAHFRAKKDNYNYRNVFTIFKKKLLMALRLFNINFSYRKIDLIGNRNCYYDEYAYNSDDLFVQYKDLIIDTFKFPELDEKNKTIADAMASESSVAVHVRRSDHQTDNNKLIVSGFFKKAVSFIKCNSTTPLSFYIFSEDIDWCKSNLATLGISEDDNVTFIDWNNGLNSYKDMQLMTFCQHNVIPISSFSWWGYYLSKRKEKIVCAPKGYWLDVKYHF